jgi:uncharacterized protein YoxC
METTQELDLIKSMLAAVKRDIDVLYERVEELIQRLNN